MAALFCWEEGGREGGGKGGRGGRRQGLGVGAVGKNTSSNRAGCVCWWQLVIKFTSSQGLTICALLRLSYSHMLGCMAAVVSCMQVTPGLDCCTRWP